MTAVLVPRSQSGVLKKADCTHLLERDDDRTVGFPFT